MTLTIGQQVVQYTWLEQWRTCQNSDSSLLLTNCFLSDGRLHEDRNHVDTIFTEIFVQFDTSLCKIRCCFRPLDPARFVRRWG